MLQRVLSRFSVEMFLSHSTETFRRGTLLCCFRNFLVGKKFMDKKSGGVGDYLNLSSKIFCLTLPKYFVEETFSAAFQKIAGSEKFYGKEMGRGGNRKFPSKILCLKMQKTFVGESYSLSLISGIEKKLCFRGLFHDFLSICFCLTTETIRRGSLLYCVSEKFWWRQSLWKRRVEGSIEIFRRKIFVSQCRNTRRGTLLCCVSENCW